VIVAVESRGFIFGAPVAAALGIGFVPVRKPGKLPFRIARRSYALEYGTDTLEMHADAVVAGARVAIVDDLLATGGTAQATVELARELGAEVAAAAFVVELAFLAGRKRLAGVRAEALIVY
jgi:adenine phosphoribosyltransferase